MLEHSRSQAFPFSPSMSCTRPCSFVVDGTFDSIQLSWIKTGTRAFQSLRRTLFDSTYILRQLYLVVAHSILLAGCETWSIKDFYLAHSDNPWHCGAVSDWQCRLGRSDTLRLYCAFVVGTDHPCRKGGSVAIAEAGQQSF